MGDNYYLGDRNGVRTPMQWSADRNAGFSKTNPQKLYLPVIIDPEYHYETVNVENRERNQASLLWWMKRFIGMRKRFKAFGRGSITFLPSDNTKVLAFLRQYQEEHFLVIVNLSRHSQVVDLDLSSFAGSAPEETFSRNRFPAIKEAPYLLTLGSYGYYLFSLRKEEQPVSIETGVTLPELSVRGSWEKVLEGRAREQLERSILPGYLRQCRWFGGKARQIQQLQIQDVIPLGKHRVVGYLLFLEVQYTEGLPETYLFPLAFAQDQQATAMREEFFFRAFEDLRTSVPGVIARLKVGTTEGILYDGVYSEELRAHLLAMMRKKQQSQGKSGTLVAYPGTAFRHGIPGNGKELPRESRVLKAEQSNTAVLYGDKLFFKLYRRLDEGINPDLEITRFLTEKTPFTHIPPFAGAIELRRPRAEPIVLGILQGFVPNEGDAWRPMIDAIGRYFERVFAKKNEIEAVPPAPISLLAAASQEIPPFLQEVIGGVRLELASLLGKRTAEMHLALASDTEDRAFAPEPFSQLYQRSVYQSMQSLARKTLQLLQKNMRNLPENAKKDAEEMLQRNKELLDQFGAIRQKKISAMKIRIHGDYHLGQVLYTGNDFVIIDFEGEPARALSERRLKRSPFRDVAGMIRSFHYAAYTALLHHAQIRPEDIPVLEPWADLWYWYISGRFLRSYLATTKDAPFIPQNTEEIVILLNAFLLDKAVYEVGYELNNRPAWVIIPLKGIKQLLEGKK
jgi:maltose alpha-D-glucosyltransferase/alpha-amylase